MIMNTKKTKYTPPMIMRHFVQALLSEGVKGNKTEAERVSGVRRQRFYHIFRTSEDFRKWFSDQCEAFLGINQAIPSYMLMKKILDGDVQAIRTYYEMAGKIKQVFRGGDVNIENHTHFTKIDLKSLEGKTEEELINAALGRG